MARVDVRSIRRDQILEAAEHLVARQGWAQTSFAEICREAGVSNGVLTYHFKDKEDLLLALYERSACTWKEHFTADSACGAANGDAANPFLAMVREAAEAVEANRQVFLLLLQYLSEAPDHPEVRERIQGMFGEMRAKMCPVIAAAWEAQGVSGDSDVASGVLQSAMAGFLILRTALGLNVPPEEMARMMSLYLAAAPAASPTQGGKTTCSGVTTA